MSKELSFALLPGLTPFSWWDKPFTAGRCLSDKLLKTFCKLHWICRRNGGSQSLKWFSLSFFLVFSFKIYPDSLVIDWMVPLLTWGLRSSLHVLLGIKSKQWIQTTFALKTDTSEVLTEISEVVCGLQGTSCPQPGPNDRIQRMTMEKSDQFRIETNYDQQMMIINPWE